MLALAALALCAARPALAQARPDQSSRLRIIEIKAPDGQILSYRHLAGSTEVQLRGTPAAPRASVKLKVGSRPGFVELDINRGGIVGLVPAHKLGKDFLTYVLWAVSVDGKASNLGEITFDGDHAVPVNVTTPYQTFWLMVTAEPHYAVVDPSSQVMLYSVTQPSVSENRAIPIQGNLFFFTHYSTYEATPSARLDAVPNQLLQARKAVELATRSGVPAVAKSGTGNFKEAEYTKVALSQAMTFLERAEAAHQQNPRDQTVIQFARTAAQSAENARALAMGAVGGLLINSLMDELDRVKRELADKSKGPQPGATAAAQVRDAASPPSSPVVEAADAVPAAATPLVKQPALWFAIAGWALAIVMLFRRRPAG
jgi:hypothetical protein